MCDANLMHGFDPSHDFTHHSYDLNLAEPEAVPFKEV
jgi:hypothetical protein